MRVRPRRGTWSAAASLIALCIAAVAASAASAAPAEGPVRSTHVTTDRVSVPVGGTMAFTVVSEVETGSPYVEVRVRVFRPSGRLLFQRTRVFNDVESSTVPAQFERELGENDIREGRYPIEVRVRARGTTGKVNEVVAQDRCLVHDPEAPRLPLAVVVRVGGAPALDPEERFVDDPAAETGVLAAAEQVVALSDSRPAVRLTAAVPPVLIEQWSRVGRGYEVAGTAGVRGYPADSPAGVRHRAALEGLAGAMTTGRLEMVVVPFSDPDMFGLAQADALGDLSMHLARGASVYRGALAATPTPGLLTAGGILAPGALGAIASQEISYAVVSPSSFSAAALPSSGTWRVADSTLTAVIADPALGRLAGSSAATPGAAFDRLFELRSADATAPVTAVVDLGPGLAGNTAALDRFMSAAESSGWVRLISVSEAAAMPPSGTEPLALRAPSASTGAPSGYWDEVGDARVRAIALAEAVGRSDPDAEAAMWRVMISESSRWAGADGKWGIADRGRAFAAAAERSAVGILSAISLAAEDVTLSGNSGQVPVVIANGSGKQMSLRLGAESGTLRIEQDGPVRVTVKPGDNYATIPVDLLGAISAEMDVELMAGDFEVASQEVHVRASVLDRLVIIGGVVLVLVGLLVVVYRKVSASGAEAPEPVDDRIGATDAASGRRRREAGKR